MKGGMGVLGRKESMCKGPEVALSFITLVLLCSMTLPDYVYRPVFLSNCQLVRVGTGMCLTLPCILCSWNSS